MLAALALMKGELSLADDRFDELTMEDIKGLIPDGLFRSLDPVLDAVSENLLAQSRADLAERGEVVAEQRFEQAIHESWERHAKLLELMQLVLLASYSQGPSSGEYLEFKRSDN